MEDDGELAVDAMVHGRNGSGTSTMVTLQCNESKYNQNTKRILERILINAGDSTTRYCSENAVKLAKVSCILLTSLGVQNTGGLPGILLSLSALGTGKVTIIGPAGLEGLLQCMFPFTNRNYPVLDVREIGKSSVLHVPETVVTPLQYFTVHVYPMTLASQLQEDTDQHENGSSSSSSSSSFHIFALSFVLQLQKKKHQIHINAKRDCNEIDENGGDDSLNTILNSLGILSVSERLTLRPSIDDIINSFKALGANTMISFPMDTDHKLSCLEDSNRIAATCKDNNMRCIVNGNVWEGRTVEFKCPQISLCLLRCLCSSLFPIPSLAAIDYLREGKDKHVNADSEDLYIKEGSVVDIRSYKHFKITKSGVCIQSDESLVTSSYIEEKLNELIEDVSSKLNVSPSVFSTFLRQLFVTAHQFSCFDENFSAADRIRNGLKKRKLSEEHGDVENIPKRGLLEDSLQLPPPNPYDIKVAFLGTGSAAPSKHRNNSAILIQVPSDDLSVGSISVLLDAGEGCATQLCMLCNGDQSRYDEILLQISIVWISHHHADHHCGLPQLVQQIHHARHRAMQLPNEINKKKIVAFSKLLVIGSEDVIRYQEYSTCVAGLEDICEYMDIKHISQQPNGDFYPKKSWEEIRQRSLSKVQEASKSLVVSMNSVSVHHCKNSFGLILHLKRQNPETIVCIVYSGDCRPSNALQIAGYGCDLLIHEATFDDTMSADACKKKHCTTSEAMSVAKKMTAKHTILTHFSQRYVRGTVQTKIDEESNTNDTNDDGNEFSVAFDFLQVHFPSQIAYLPRITENIVKCLEIPQSGDD